MAAAAGAVAALAVGGYLFTRSKRAGSGMAKHFIEFVELDVPVSTAYNQWTQFEEFPKFMATVQSVQQVDDTHLHWRALVGG
ncbi:MAG TPA: SRPBCC family protein, partial [Ramlibacter sp.]|nr:SRPBCC family protein [Ramlibacter sp.]